jgi:4-azaleucine resistance transporter AzlC
VYAGGAQFLAVGLVSAGGTALAIVLAGLLLNARHLPFGLAIGNETLGDSRWRRIVGSHILTDESVAFALAQDDPARRRRAFWLTGAALYVTWNVSSTIGAIAGSALGDPDTFGIDAAFPAALLALTLPSLKDKVSVRVAIAGAAIALVATPFLPAGLPVLLALLGLAFALPVPSPKRSK